MANDYYQRLGVSRQASVDELKRAYRRLAKQHHPDVNPGSKTAEEKFKQVTEAFEVLGDPRKRKLYDEFGDDAAKIGWDEKRADALRAYRDQATSGGAGFGGGPFNFDFGGAGIDFESIFGEMFGGRRGGRGPRPGPDASATLHVSLRDAVLGAEHAIAAGGKRLAVKIPPGVATGSKIRLAGQGGAGERGGPAGDLYVEIVVTPHPLVRREGNDLLLDLPVTVQEAFFGGEIDVPTFRGRVTVKVRARTQSGTRLRLRGQGVPDLRDGPPGDLYLIVQIKLPEAHSDAVKRAVQTIEGAYHRSVREDLAL